MTGKEGEREEGREGGRERGREIGREGGGDEGREGRDSLGVSPDVLCLHSQFLWTSFQTHK